MKSLNILAENYFEIGQKIVFYESAFRHIGTIILLNGYDIQVRVLNSDDIFQVHYKQCRPLKKKRKPMELWVNAYKDGGLCIYSDEEKSKADRGDRLHMWFKVREVIGK